MVSAGLKADSPSLQHWRGIKGFANKFASYNCSFAVCTNIWNIVLNVTVGYYYSWWFILTMNMAQTFKLSCKCKHHKTSDIMNCMLNWEPILRNKCKKKKGTSV